MYNKMINEDVNKEMDALSEALANAIHELMGLGEEAEGVHIIGTCPLLFGGKPLCITIEPIELDDEAISGEFRPELN